MVQLEIGADGLVVLTYGAPDADSDEADYLAALRDIGGLDRSYALMARLAGGRKLSHEAEVAQNKWFKATRDRVSAHCRGLAIVRRDASSQMQESFQKLYPFPVVVTADEAEARSFCLGRLADPSRA